MTHSVEVACVEQGHAGIQRGVNGGDALGAILGRAIKVRHAHAAKTQRGGDGAGRAKLTGNHERLHLFKSPVERDDRPSWRAPLDKLINHEDAVFERSAQRLSH